MSIALTAPGSYFVDEFVEESKPLQEQMVFGEQQSEDPHDSGLRRGISIEPIASEGEIKEESKSLQEKIVVGEQQLEDPQEGGSRRRIYIAPTAYSDYFDDEYVEQSKPLQEHIVVGERKFEDPHEGGSRRKMYISHIVSEGEIKEEGKTLQ